jgi:hypothetical protein
MKKIIQYHVIAITLLASSNCSFNTFAADQGSNTWKATCEELDLDDPVTWSSPTLKTAPTINWLCDDYWNHALEWAKQARPEKVEKYKYHFGDYTKWAIKKITGQKTTPTINEDTIELAKDVALHSVDKTFRKALLIAHPDKGGTNEATQELLSKKESLTRCLEKKKS